MELNTRIVIPQPPFRISYTDNLLLLGSCFAESIGQKLSDNKFRTDINPFGTLYNPASIASAIHILKEKKQYTSTDLFMHNGLFNSWDHHSRFSFSTEKESLFTINERINYSSAFLPTTRIALITLGTRYIYRLKDSGRIVANCHKFPEKTFNRYPLKGNDIVTECRLMIDDLKELNPDIKIIFTVSPIRHWKDGPHNNQLSKAALLLAIEQIQAEYGEAIAYFPAYEIMMDELRDYRFYADDMVHPSALAVEYIWQRFIETFVNQESVGIMKEWQDILRAINHKPFNPGSVQYQNFILQTLLKMERITEKIPYFDIANEIKTLKSKLN